MFIGRAEEKKVLHDFFTNNSKKAALIFGKRRVGKTTLIIEASRRSLSHREQEYPLLYRWWDELRLHDVD